MLETFVTIYYLGVFGALSGSYALLMLVPLSAMYVRRLHDLEFSGWWTFIALIPYLGLLVLVVLVLLPGQSVKNKYGRAPR